MRIGLIASGAFLPDSLSAELGRIPPCLVPLGSRRLLYRQYTEISKLVDKVYVSLPEGFDLHPEDRQQIEALGLTIISSDPTLRIGEAIANCVNDIGIYDAEIVVLYGDTVITGIEKFSRNAVSVHSSWGEYRWADLEDLFGSRARDHAQKTLSGLFAFSSIPNLLRSIIRAKGDFLSAIRLYDEQQSLSLVTDGDWFDFGHVQTYFRSTGLVTTERGFNKLQISIREVIKGSENTRKIKSEAAWFTDIPAHMRAFTPAFLGERTPGGLAGYATANTYLSTLSNLAVYGELQTSTWVAIFDACAAFLKECRAIRPEAPLGVDADLYFGSKTRERIETFAATEHGCILERARYMDGRPLPSVSEMVEVTSQIISDMDQGPECMIHGDFCFSNIFFDFRSVSVRVIDPRGELPDGTRSIHGLQSYDVAKLAHSVIGGYDLIIAGYVRARLERGILVMEAPYRDNTRWGRIIDAFRNSAIANTQSPREIDAMLVHLFLSMLPLHSDRPDRQVAMLGTAYKSFFALEA